MISLSISEAIHLCTSAAVTQGASPSMASSLANATVAAEVRGKAAVGISHLFDYLEAMQAGRIHPTAVPKIHQPTPCIFLSDAQGSIAQFGFDLAVDQLVTATQQFGIAIFSQKNAYTCGELGYFVEKLAQEGLIGLGFGNSPALMAAGGARQAIYGTNPFAFAAPQADAPPVLIDQASSATAYVNIRAAANNGQDIPLGWAIDADGQPTQNPHQALKGALQAFGGTKGGNMALVVEILSTLAGAQWSLDAPSFLSGSTPPAVGLTIIAIQPEYFDPTFKSRLAEQTKRLSERYQVYIPGQHPRHTITLPIAIYERLCKATAVPA